MRSLATSKLVTRSVIVLSSSFANLPGAFVGALFGPLPAAVPLDRCSTIAARARRWPSRRAVSRALTTVSAVASTATVAENGSGSSAKPGGLPTLSAATTTRAAQAARRLPSGHPPPLPAAAGISGKTMANSLQAGPDPLSSRLPDRRCGDSAVFAGTPSTAGPRLVVAAACGAVEAEARWHGSRSAC